VYTFETHKKNIFRKLEINSSNELMRIAIDFNIK
jgi:DNA-binding CsgD family transcriptional regulator